VDTRQRISVESHISTKEDISVFESVSMPGSSIFPWAPVVVQSKKRKRDFESGIASVWTNSEPINHVNSINAHLEALIKAITDSTAVFEASARIAVFTSQRNGIERLIESVCMRIERHEDDAENPRTLERMKRAKGKIRSLKTS